MSAPHQPTHRVGVFAIMRDEQGRILISRRVDNGWYNLPGGGLEPHETVTEGLSREIREETGLEARCGRLVGVYSKPQKHEIVLTLEATVTGGTLTATSEADDHRWIAPETLEQYRILPKHLARIRDALRNDPAAVVRDQRTSSAQDQAQR